MRGRVSQAHGGALAALAALAWLVCTAFVARGAAAAAEPTTPAPAVDEISAARALFYDALRDEEAKRFQDALAKFQKVSRVKDTAAVEYRIATCFEALGEAAAAYRAYLAAIDRAEREGGANDVADAARARLKSLEGRVARLTLIRPPDASATAARPALQVDGVAVADDAMTSVLEPGAHVVTSTTPQGATTRTEISLAPGADVSFTIPEAAPPPSPPAAAAPRDADGRPPVAAWVLVGGGAVLLAGGGALLLARDEQIASLDRACPGGVCGPGSSRSELEGRRREALAEGPAAVALGVAGVAALGIGIWLAWPPKSSPPGARSAANEGVAIVPVLGPAGAELVVHGALR